jgi:hypothetical protein
VKALRQLGFLKLGLRPDGSSEDDGRVLALFRNRAELKKAYGELQDEIFRLKDLIKQQEAATQRVQEMLAALEGRLATPETAYPTLVFYQLRRLWQSGRDILTQFVVDLARQQEEQERRAHLAQHNRRQFARRQAAEKEVQAAQAHHLESGAQVAALESERTALARWWHYFKRRALERRIGAAREALAGAGAALGQAQLGLEAIAREATPEFPGLSLEARRAINLAAIAYAQTLCLRLTELKAPLVTLAREASGRRAAGGEYGTPQQCVLLMGQIQRAQQLLAAREGISAQIRAGSQRLKPTVRYRSSTDSTPVNESLNPSEGDVLAQRALAGIDLRALPNVLAEDTWDLFRVLLR